MRFSKLTNFQVFSFLILAFSLGFSLKWAMNIYERDSTQHVPVLTFLPVLSMPEISLQIAVIDVSPDQINMWVHEQRPLPFIAESSVLAHSTISKVFIDCKGGSIELEEQRVFGPGMKHLATITNPKTPSLSKSIMLAFIYTVACRPDKVDDTKVSTA